MTQPPRVPMDDLLAGMHQQRSAAAAHHPSPQGQSPTTPARPDPQPAPELPPPPPRRWADELDASQQAVLAPVDTAPAPSGWRAAARRLGLPVSTEPKASVLYRHRQDAARSWASVKTITIANPKGGSGKTPLAVVLAEAFSQCRGGGVGLMDNNPTGTARERILATPGQPSATIEDVVSALDWLERPDARANDLFQFLRYQADGNIRALLARTRATHRDESGQIVPAAATISPAEFHRIWTLLARHFQPIIIDSGNNDADAPWRTALHVTDQLVVPLRWDRDYCMAASQMLAAMQDSPAAHLAEHAIVVATWPPGEKTSAAKTAQYRQQFERWGHEVLHLPPDPHIQERGPILWSRLATTTQEAAITLAGTIARRMQ